MKITFTLPIFICFALIVLQSCSKESQQDMVMTTPAVNVINASVAANSNYELNLDKYESVTISKQAAHYFESSAGISNKTGKLVYKYVPDSKFRGEDEVVLTSLKTVTSYSGGSGCNHGDNNSQRINTVTNYITIKFRITD
jgi:hypothetical protein